MGPARRAAVGYLQMTYAFSERRACRVVGAQRRTMRYRRRVREDEADLRARLRNLAGLRRRWGYRRLHVLLQREGGRINPKRVYRLYREERLALRRRKRKRVAVPPRGAGAQIWQRGEAWSMDFMQDLCTMCSSTDVASER
jgi:putative transposase